MILDPQPPPSDSSAPPMDREFAARQREQDVRAFLDRHGLRVKSLERVLLALTHRSYAFEHEAAPDNERLEFLGDAVLTCLAAEFLYERFPGENEGDLSKKKGFLVSRIELGRRAHELGMSGLILLGRGEESSGGRKRLSVVGSALEALMGALYFETPFDALRRFVRENIAVPGLEALARQAHPDFKSRLQELLQKSGRSLPLYQRACEEGPAHKKRFVVEVYVEGQLWGTGEGARVKTAENHAARQAYEALGGLAGTELPA